MIKELLTSLRLVVLSMVFCCLLYPAVLLAFGQLVVPDRADGSLIRDSNGQVIGSSMIAQGFKQPRYFWPRPSAVDYNAAATGGSNLSPKNPAVTERAKATIDAYALTGDQMIPADLVTTSGSGMDPHISIAAATLQVARVARERGLSEPDVQALIEQNTQIPTLRVLGGEPVVNVLLLNLALDNAAPTKGQ